MKYLRVGLPIFVVVASIWCLVLSVMENNYLGTMGYITALFGWIAIVCDEYTNFRIQNRSV